MSSLEEILAAFKSSPEWKDLPQLSSYNPLADMNQEDFDGIGQEDCFIPFDDEK